MSDLTSENILNGRDYTEDFPRLRTLIGEHRWKLEEGNAVEYWEKIEVTTPSTANSEFLVQLQTLNRTPSEYIIIKKDKAVDVYTGDTAWSRNKLWLKATVASATIKLLVIG